METNTTQGSAADDAAEADSSDALEAADAAARAAWAAWDAARKAMGEKRIAMKRIADLAYECDPDNDGGYVAVVGSGLLARSFAEQLEAAGFSTSTSRDDAGEWYVWVD